MKLFLPILVSLLLTLAATEDLSFTYNGFKSANLTLDGLAQVTSNGLLQLTNHTKQKTGHAFFPDAVNFKDDSTNSTTASFSTTFVFAIISEYATLSGHGLAFVLAPTRGLPGAISSQYLGLFHGTNDGNATNHVVAVELDTIFNPEMNDTNDNHLGIDINGLKSAVSNPAAYFDDKKGRFKNLTLFSGKPMQVWVEYDGIKKEMNVTIAPVKIAKPGIPLLSLKRDLSSVIKPTMYVGFSSSTGSVFTSHYVLEWSFKLNGQVKELDFSKLPKLPRMKGKTVSKILTIGLPQIIIAIVLLTIVIVVFVTRRKRKFAEVKEDWEHAYGPHRFKYKDLYVATKGFKNKDLLGIGGFGTVHRGLLHTSKTEIAVKRVSHESRQGMREFIAEIVSLGRLRHRNIVTLLGYCRRKGELLLVYDYMPNGSLDKYLFDQPKFPLSWYQRYQIIKGVASGLLYLHEEWEQVVIHRDVKASNVLLDGQFNGRLGDFGLAKLHDHGSDPRTTRVVGTLGYLAPENARTGKATTRSDVFSFGAFLLEVACGRRPIEAQEGNENLMLVDWVFLCWEKGQIVEARDAKLREEYIGEEVELVLKLGLLCSLLDPVARPSMREVVQYLAGDIPLPDFPFLGISAGGLTFMHSDGFDDFVMSYGSASTRTFMNSSASQLGSVLSGGR